MFGDFPFRLNDYLDEDLIQELIDQGIIDNEYEVSGVTRNRGIQDIELSRNIWVTERDFIHILDGHKDEIIDIFKISDNPHTIGNNIFYSIKTYPIVKTEIGSVPGAIIYIYKIFRSGDTNYLHILVDEDGHIVTAYTTPYITGEGTFV